MSLHRIAAPLIAAALALLAACDGGTGATPVDTVIIETDDFEVGVGGTLQLAATAYDSRGNEITGRNVDWSTSDPGVATIDGSGVLRGVSGGSVRVTAEIGGESDSQTFDVVRTFRSCAAMPYAIGQEVTGALRTTDCEVRIEGGEKYVDVYRLNLAQRRAIVVAAVADDREFDAYLYLYDRNGELLDENDDLDADTRDALIDAVLPAGEYYVVVSSFYSSGSAPEGHGLYTLLSGFED